MNTKKVYLVQTGTANVASVCAALRRASATPVFAQSAEEILRARFLVLPGVGAFGAAMKNLQSAGWVEPLRARFQVGRPTLAICLGLQLLAESSEESPGVTGLGVVPGVIERFSEPLRIPQFGWSPIQASSRASFLRSGYSYFANSFCMRKAPEGWDVAYADYGGAYIAAMERKGVLACQFHPELSGQWGHDLLTRWLEQKERK